MNKNKSELWLKVEGFCDVQDALQLVLEETGKQKEVDGGDSSPAFDLTDLRELLRHVQRVNDAKNLYEAIVNKQRQQLMAQGAAMQNMALNSLANAAPKKGIFGGF